MILAGLGLLPEPGKHEISQFKIPGAEKKISLSFSLSSHPSLASSFYCPSKILPKVYIKIPSLRVIYMSTALPAI
jgi:hypothetical protein